MKIGITCSYRTAPASDKEKANLQHYIAALADAGAEGTPLWRPQIDDENEITTHATKIAAQLDGLIISGGKDLDPQSYGETILPDAKVELAHPLRTRFETILIRLMRQQKKPILGICYGSQLFNVLQGGTLLQDIPLQRPQAFDHSNSRHIVHLEPNSFLFELIGLTEFEIVSYHHQAIDQIAPDAAIAALSPDGIIEAIELDRNPFWLGVQWHPERARESQATQKLFAAFVGACSTTT